MARRRKTEVKASEKTSHKHVPVRKSSRQIAKKQLEEKKINGVITPTVSEDSSSLSTSEDHIQVVSKKNQKSQKKNSKHKGTSSNNVVVNSENTAYSASQYKRDASESDSQDNVDNAINKSGKLSPENAQQAVVINPSNESLSVSASMSSEVEMWPEDVVEETIICEEMEVEESVADNSYSLMQDNAMNEQTPHESNLGGKNFTEVTVIQNKNDTESMIVESESENMMNNKYRAIPQNSNSVYKPENSISIMHTDKSVTSSSGNCNIIDPNAGKAYINKKKIVLEDRSGKKQRNNKTIYDKIKKEISESISNKISMCSIKDHSDFSNKEEDKVLETKIVHVDSAKEDILNKIDNKLADMQISVCSKEIQKLVNDLSSVENIDSPVQPPLSTEKLSPVDIDDESSSSILDKMEQLHRPNNSVGLHVTEMFSKIVEPNNIIKDQEQDISKSDSCNDKIQYADRVSLKSKITQDKKYTSQPKNIDHLVTIDEYHDSEKDNNKADSEDLKLCSSSENSNDTLLSFSNCKGPEFDMKSVTSNSSDIDKKGEFRPRSGSTDTTGSESGSNSSGVRRSSRIRSIGLMKQRYKIKSFILKCKKIYIIIVGLF